MKPFSVVALALSAAFATPTLAATVVFTGTTAGGPTYNRPLSGRPPGSLSGVGTAVHYAVTPFTVTQSGNYDFLNSSIYDSFLGIHANAFNPSTPLLNALAYDDDAGPGSDSAITALGLSTGVSYFAVSSGFANSDFGNFSLTISGPGDIQRANAAAVPEPAAWAMMIIGFGVVGGAMRRRRQLVTVTYA